MLIPKTKTMALTPFCFLQGQCASGKYAPQCCCWYAQRQRLWQEVCQKIVADLQKYQVNIISGLAYGIDHAAHAGGGETTNAYHWCGSARFDTIYRATQIFGKQNAAKWRCLSEFFIAKPKPTARKFSQAETVLSQVWQMLFWWWKRLRYGSITAHLAFSYNRDAGGSTEGQEMRVLRVAIGW